MKYAFYLLSFVLIFGISCSEDEETRSSEEQILSYLEANDLEAEKTSSGLYYIIEVEGNWQAPHPHLLRWVVWIQRIFD